MNWKELFFKLALLAVVAYFTIGAINDKEKIKDFSVIHNDVNFYYSYLPAIFIYGDMSFQFVDDLAEKDRKKIWFLTDPDGNRHSKMTAGNAVMYLPFFLGAHAYALNSDYDANGYSVPYDKALHYSALVYLLFGLWILMGLLLKYYSWTAVALTVIGLALGTNLFYYTTHESAMTHVNSFFLFVLFIYFTERWHRKKFQVANSIYLGLCLGLIILIRPTNGLIALLPLLYGISDFKSIWGKIVLVFKQKWSLLALIFSASLVIFIQPFLWKLGTGNWIIYSYGEEGFFFTNPKIIEGLFSYRKGWLIYTPIMALSLIGFYYLFKTNSKFKWSIVVYFVLHIYVTFSWWCWWYGGSFGSRPMIETYAVLVIPMTAFFQEFTKKSWFKTALLAVLIYFAVKLNFFQTKQYVSTLIHWDSMTKEAYWAVFMKEEFPPNYVELIEAPDYEKAKAGRE